MSMGEITVLIADLKKDAGTALPAVISERMRLAADALAAMQRHAFNVHDVVYL
jgi:hypothetical protein